MLPKFKLIIFSFLVLIAIVLVSTLVFVSSKIKSFENNSGTSIKTVISQISKGLKESPVQTKIPDTLVFLILGTNEIPGRPVPPITDTILAGSINFKTGYVGLFSIPRDIWSIDYKTKIDALYTYGLTKYPGTPEKFTDDVVGAMANLNFDKTIVITPQSFVDMINLIGGIDINVTHPFVDNLYPRSDVDVTKVTDPKLLYETVEFKSGWQHMDGDLALKYVRSRHSTGIEGSDIARSVRQREVLSILATKFKDPKFYTNPQLLGKLYKFYSDNFSKYLSISDAISLAKQIYPIRNKLNIAQGSPESIYHPNFSPLNDGQWVFLIKNDVKFKEEVKSILLP